MIEDDNTVYVLTSQIAMDSSGNAIAVWIQSDGTYYSIYANRFD